MATLFSAMQASFAQWLSTAAEQLTVAPEVSGGEWTGDLSPSQLRVEKFVVRMRFAACLVASIAVPLIGVANLLQMYAIIAGFAIYSGLAHELIRRRAVILAGGYLLFSLDGVFLGLAAGLTGGFDSPFAVCYFPAVALNTFRFRGVQVIYAPAVGAATLFAGAVAFQEGPHDFGRLAFLVFWLTLTALLVTLMMERARTAERALGTELRRTRALLQAAYAPAASLTLSGVLGAVVHHSRLLTEADCAGVLLYSQNNEPTMYKEQLDDRDGAVAFADLVRNHARARQFLLKSARPVTPAELAENAPSVPLALDQFRSFCAVPISGPRGKVGLVAVASRHLQLNPFHYEALAAFLERAALAIQNARLYEQLQSQMQELRTLHDHIVRAERLAAIGELAAKVAHELNNPLASIHLYNSLLLEQPADADEQRRLAENVREQVERAKRVVRDILDYSRPAQAQLQTTSLNAAVEQGMRFVRHAANAAKVTVVEDYGNNLPWVRVDVSRMAQVFTNLTMNAIQSMPRGGKLEISTGIENNELYVRFKDTGTGISPDDMERIFDPFFTTKPSGQGTGLGLAVCRTLVNQHHGDITVETEPGKGSTFTVWLPAAEVKETVLAR
jgi:signal transduction histidine kinase